MAQFAATYIDAKTFEVAGDQRAHFLPNRAVKANCGGTFVNSHVDVSIYTTVTTVTLLTSVLTNPITMVYDGLDPASLPIHTHENESQGGSGVVGQPPDHEWSGTQLRFRLPNGTWASYVDLKGNPGADGADGTDGLSINPRGAWAPTTSYAKGDLVSNRGSSYVCQVAHIADASSSTLVNQPGIGSATATYWTVAEQAILYFRGAWSSASVAYYQGDGVTYGGSLWRADFDQTSSPSNYPGVGNWTQYVSKGDTGAQGIQGNGIGADNALLLPEISAPANPASGSHKIYFKSDTKLYKRDSAGAETEVGSGTGGTGITLRWEPPALYPDPGDATAVGWDYGEYYKLGIRGLGQYWGDLNAGSFTALGGFLHVNNSYSAGVTPGILGGRVANSWYALFMVGVDDVIMLPYIRVQAVSGGDTITPGDHATGSSVENGFLTANSQWNDYVLYTPFTDPSVGAVSSAITACTTGSPDAITNTIASVVSAGDWLMLTPPVATPYVYIGSVFLDGSSNVQRFRRFGWKTYWHHVRPSVSITGATTYGAVDISPGVCPWAFSAIVSPFIDGGANNGAVKAQFADVDGNAILREFIAGADANHSVVAGSGELLLDQTAKVNTRFMRTTGGSDYAANGTLYLQGWRE